MSCSSQHIRLNNLNTFVLHALQNAIIVELQVLYGVYQKRLQLNVGLLNVSQNL